MPADPLLVTADNVWFYPNILHEAGLQALKEALERRKNKKISTNNLVEMAAFVLKNNDFEFNEGGNHQISGSAIGTKFAPTYGSIFMEEIEINFLDTKEFSLGLWYGFNIPMIIFSFRHMVKKNWKSS